MSIFAMTSNERLVFWALISFSILSAIFLTVGFFQHAWLIDANGQLMATDFVNVYAAGTFVADGHSAIAYDWSLHRLAEVRVLGHDFNGYFGWHYPPPFLAVAELLSRLPYLAAFFAWVGIGLVLYFVSLRLILGKRLAIAAFFSVPAVMWNVALGQNGLVTAALMGIGTWCLFSRPIFAGICFGLLSYKPQFGLLLPLLLLMEKRWSTIGAAFITTVVMAVASFVVFGAESWQAFFQWMPVTTRAVLIEGEANFSELQSVLGVARWLGMVITGALALQVSASLGMLVIAYRLRLRACEEMGAAIFVLMLLFFNAIYLHL